MFRKAFFFVCITAFAFAKAYSQVNLQTGSAVFSLPMFNWQDDKSRLNSVVALSYSSGNGLKVNDVASNVGQGWNLVAGGVITRMQVGEPDDQMAYPNNVNNPEADIRKYPNGYLYATKAATDGCPDALRLFPIYKQRNQLYTNHNEVIEDKQLDYFSFQFNGKAGMFVLNKTSDIGLSVGDSKMKITFVRDQTMKTDNTSGMRTTIKSFTIQDVDGLIYKFTQHGTSKVLETSFCDVTASYPMRQPTMEGNKVYHQAGFDNTSDVDPNKRYVNPFIINSWYLEEIEDALTHRKIFFKYVTRNINTIAGEDITFNEEGGYAIISHKTSITKTPVIDSILYPDGHLVRFNYGDDRFDMIGDKVLSSVDFLYQGRSLSKYLLNTSYFIRNRYGTPVYDFQKKLARLCLRSVQKVGVDLKEDTPPYLFDYYCGSNVTDDFVPPPFFWAKDVWGFYNGNNSKNYLNGTIQLSKSINELSPDELKGLCFRRNGVSAITLNANPAGYAKNGLLKQIVYPTGGTLIYEYGQNTGTIPNGGPTGNVGGVHVTATQSTDGGFSNSCSNPLITQYNYVIDDGVTSSMWGLEMPVNKIYTNAHYKPEQRKWKYSGGLFGSCYFKYQYPGILSLRQSVDLAGFQKFMANAAPVLQILTVVSTIVDVVNLIATSFAPAAVIAVVVDILAGLVSIILTCFNNPEDDFPSTVYYNSDLNGVSPLPTQFKRVEVVEIPPGGGSGAIGKTIHEFTDDSDYPVWIPADQNTTMSAKQRFAPWAYGLPKLITVKDNSGNIIRETINTYNFSTYYNSHGCVLVTPDHYDRARILKKALGNSSCKCLVKNSNSQRNDNWANATIYNNPSTYLPAPGNSNVSVDIYDMYTGRTELNVTKEKVYKPNSAEFLETVTEYVYNDENYEISLIKTKRSEDGQFTYTQKNIFYTIDFIKVHGNCYVLSSNATTNPQIIALVQNNIISQVVETNEMITNDGSTFKYLYDKATVFTTLSNGDIKPSIILEGRLSQPTVKTFYWENDYSNFSYFFPQPLYNPSAAPDYAFYKAAQTFTYDNTTSFVLKGVKDESNRVVSNIYDYSDKYIVASVINADPSLDKYAYTSFETTVLGNWTLGGGAAVYSSTGITGARSLTLSGRTLSSALTTTKPHTVSFWASASGVTLSAGATLMKSGPTLNGFTYYEYDIVQGTASISLSGTPNIDEVRLYPKAARMRTVTYDALIGKTSECDENNRITYYEYDNLGRLLFIKDEKKNIVKMYEYNNVTAAKQQGCPGTYYNRLISETFTRNNCGANFIGGSYTYTIAANTFSSTISQADADAKAENQILTSGQAAANANASCIPIYKNQAQSQVFVKENCQPGFMGTNVTYTVPANRYTSTISLADANQKALDEIAANGYSYANSVTTACVVDPNPDWEWDNINSQCQVAANGEVHLFVFEKDVNPNSPSFNQTRWSDVGPDGSCPACMFGDAQGFDVLTSQISSSGVVVTFYIVVSSLSGTTNWTTSNKVAIVGGCRPSATRTFNVTSGSLTWEVVVTPAGEFWVRLISGTPPSGSTPIGLSGAGCTYNL